MKKYQVIEGGKIKEVNDWIEPFDDSMKDFGLIAPVHHVRYQSAKKAYDEHVANLKEYPYSASLNFKVGQIVEEGKDFEFERLNDFPEVWGATPMNNSTASQPERSMKWIKATEVENPKGYYNAQYKGELLSVYKDDTAWWLVPQRTIVTDEDALLIMDEIKPQSILTTQNFWNDYAKIIDGDYAIDRNDFETAMEAYAQQFQPPSGNVTNEETPKSLDELCENPDDVIEIRQLERAIAEQYGTFGNALDLWIFLKPHLSALLKEKDEEIEALKRTDEMHAGKIQELQSQLAKPSEQSEEITGSIVARIR